MRYREVIGEVFYPNRPEGLFPASGWTYDVFDQQKPDFERTGADYDILYHSGPVQITKIDPTKLQQMDNGFYGKGFYVTSDRRFAATGGVSQDIVSEFRLIETARVLVVRKDNGLIHVLRRFLYESEIENVRDDRNQDAELKLIGQCTLMPWHDDIFIKTADRYAIVQGYDAADYRASEIVIKAADKLVPI